MKSSTLSFPYNARRVYTAVKGAFRRDEQFKHVKHHQKGIPLDDDTRFRGNFTFIHRNCLKIKIVSLPLPLECK